VSRLVARAEQVEVVEKAEEDLKRSWCSIHVSRDLVKASKLYLPYWNK